MRSLDDMAADFATEQKLRNANPDEDAKVIRLSERSGLARETVRRNLDSFADEFAAEYDLEGIDQDAPSMANLLRDPDGAALIADEVDYLRESEKDLGDDPSWLGGTLLSGLYQFAGGLAASAAPSATDALPGTMGLTGITLGDVSDQESIDIMRDAALGEAEALQGEAAELFPYEPGTDVWESIPVFSAYAIQGIARMAPGLLVGAATRNPGAASATIGADVYGATLLEGKQLGLTENETKARASFGSLIETVTGLAPWQRILKPLENIQLKSRLAKLAGAAGAEAGQEALVEGLQQAFDQGLLGLDQEKTFWDNLTDIGKAASLGAAIGGGLAAPSVILARGDQDAIDSERDQAKIDRLMDMADNVKLRERSEPLFDSYMESLADNYDIDAVFVDAGNVLFQDQPEIAQDRVVGTDIRIPLGEFMKLPKDAREALRADMRIRPDAMSANDLGTIEESLQADIEASAGIARQRVENSSAAREYRNALALQIAESGGPYNANESRAVATMMSDYLLTKAEREGLPFSEVAEVMPLTVEGEGFSGGETFNQRQDPAEPRLQALHTNVPAIEYGVRYDEGARARAIQEATQASDREGVLFQPPIQIEPVEGIDRASAKEAAAEKLEGNSYPVPAIGQDVLVTNGSIKKALSGVATYRDQAAYLSLPELLASARHLRSGPDNRGRPNVVAHHTLGVKAQLGDELLDIQIGVREMVDGSYQWGFTALPEGGAAPEGSISSQAVEADIAVQGSEPQSGTSADAESASRQQSLDDTPPDILIQPASSGAPRGSIELFPSSAIIRLGETSDRSTFFHEAGHYFLEMERRFAERDGATARQRDDWKQILDYLEVESGDQIETVHHEKWARSFEKYIAEGRAPSLEMRSVFRRFADWLTRVYRSLSALNVELTDDIRSVMDRMLATDEQIERASHWYGLEPTQASTDAGENGQDRAKESLRSQLMRELKARAEKSWKEERSGLVDEQMKELAESKLYTAIEAMKESKVDRAQVLDVLGLENLAGQTRLRGLTQKDGLDIDDFAEMSGFGSGHWMMEEIQQSRPLRKAAEDAADALMLERHGDLLSDGRIGELADQAIHNEEQGRALLAELRSLRGGRGGADTLVIKHWAEEQVGQLRTSEIRPLTFQRQEVKAARAYERAIVEGDTELAAQFKLEQLQAFHLTRAAMRAKERVERYRKALKGYQSREYRDTEVRPDYAQNLRTYAKLYDFRKGGEPMAEAELGKLHAWLKSQIEDENEYIQPQIFDLVMTQLGAPDFQLPSWSEMTVDEFQGVYDQALHLRFMGGRLSESESAKRKLEAEALSEHIDSKGGASKAERPFDGPLETIKRDTRRFFADHMRLLNRVRRIDGFEEDGLFKQKVYDPLSDASIREVELSREMGTRIEPLMRTVSTMDYMRGRGKRTIMTEAGREFTLPARERIMLGLYWGTPESRQALMDGYGLTEADVERMLAFLKPHELDFIEGIWEANESLWPEFSAMNTRMFGHSPAKVDRLPFQVNGREMKGGYMRLFYRPAAKDAGNTALDKLLEGNPQGGGRHLGMTKSGAAIQRQGSGGRRVALDIANIGRGLEDVIHSIAFSEASRVVGRRLQSEPVAQAIRDKHGEEVHKSLMDTVRSMIEPQNSANQTLVTRMLRYVRSNMSLGLLGYSIRNFIQQPIALTNGFAVLGEAAVIRGLMKFYTSPTEHYEWVNERSVFMQNRMKFVNREATELLNQLGQNTAFAKFKTHAFSLQTFGDAMVAYPIWLAGYEKGLEIHSGDEVKAAKHADDQVAGTIGSGMARDLSPMMSGSGVIGDRAGNSELAKQFTFMGSYFNVVYNLMADSVGKFDARSPKTYLEFGRSMFWLLLAPALISRLVISHFPGEDDEESVAQWVAEAVAEYGLASVFLLREVMTVYKGFDPKITGLDAFPGMKRVASEIGEATEEREVTENDAAQLLRGLMPLAPLPGSGQLARTLQYIESADEGGESNALPIYDALVEGKERNE